MADPEPLTRDPASSTELGFFLVQRGWLTPDQLRQALDRQRLAGGHLDTCLLEAGAATEGRLLEGLSQVYGVPAASADDLRKASENAYRLLPAKVARRFRAVPFRIVGSELWVALEDVSDLLVQDELTAVTGRRLRPHVAIEARIAEALQSYYDEPASERLATLLGQLNRPPTLWGHFAPAEAETVPLTPEEKARLQRPPGGPQPAVETGEAAPAAGGQGGSDVPLALEEAERRLDRATGREEIGSILLDYLSQPFRRVLIFKVQPAGVEAWMGKGPGLEREQLQGFSLGFERPSVFLNLRQGAGFHLGPLPPMPTHLELARMWGGGLPREVMVWPVLVRNRMVVVLYGDRGKAPLAGVDVAALRRLASAAAQAFELYLMRRKHRKS